MVMRFTATVKNREVVIRDVQLPDGEVVDVTIEQPRGYYKLTAAERREADLGAAEIAAGNWVSLDDFLAEVKARRELRGQGVRAGATKSSARNRAMGAARPRSKPARGRARSDKR